MVELPIVKVGNTKWYVDNRLQEIRNVRNPHDKVTFAELDEWTERLSCLCLEHTERQRLADEVLDLLAEVVYV